MSLGISPELTFKHNVKLDRHGWLRLTPAYSMRIVENIFNRYGRPSRVLDPFAGTGTTGLVAAERGVKSTLNELNPFLVWLCQAKTRNYSEAVIENAKGYLYEIIAELREKELENPWLPPISNIDRWWDMPHACLLGQIRESILKRLPENSLESDLLLIGFCKMIIRWSKASFGHQSMSFKKNVEAQLYHSRSESIEEFEAATLSILRSVETEIPGAVSVVTGDARNLTHLEGTLYDCVITSPPYPNRMSYVRELRPYMFWLGYLSEAREAGELDWQAIGGTWGIATSRVAKGSPAAHEIQSPELLSIVKSIQSQSDVLGRYVHKYFVDISLHLNQLARVVSRGGRVHYIVGNSKFYDTLLPVERIYRELLMEVGFEDSSIEVIRKRTSKTELFEYVVSAVKT